MRRGVAFGIAAYGLWGLFPLYFPLLDPAGPAEVLAHRIAWSLVVVGALLALRGRLRPALALLRDRRRRALLGGAAVLIAANWGVYIYAVTHDQVIEAALGYFINPLVSVAYGLAVFGERLGRVQVAALALGAVAVAILTVAATGFPWIALVLALSFGTYGLLKKLAGAGAAESLGVETLLLLLPALALLAVLGATGRSTFAGEGAGHALLLAAAGPVTAIPLLFFAGAATRLPLTTLGLLQYLAPVLQFLLGWLVAGEAMPLSRWVGFALVWTALVLLTADGLRRAGGRAALRRAPVPA
jgi:chloramphenicol-sensitive protein RarD